MIIKLLKHPLEWSNRQFYSVSVILWDRQQSSTTVVVSQVLDKCLFRILQEREVILLPRKERDE